MLFPSPWSQFPANAGCSAVCSQVISPVMRWCLCLGEQGERPGQCSGREYKCGDQDIPLSLSVKGSNRLFRCCHVRALEMQIEMHVWDWIIECFCALFIPCCELQDHLRGKEWYYNWGYRNEQRKFGQYQRKCCESKFTSFAGGCLIARDCSSYFERTHLPLGRPFFQGHLLSFWVLLISGALWNVKILLSTWLSVRMPCA